MGWPVRYRIVGLIFLLALINHIDRANISIAAPDMISALGWDEAQFGIIFSAFLWGYTALQLPGGYLADRFGWPWVFYVSGAVGIAWAFLWLWLGRETPEQHTAVSAEELAYIQAERVQPSAEHAGWGPAIRSPRVWALVAAYTFWVYTMWLMAAWLPTYLVRGRGFSVAEMGWWGGLITGAALVGTLGGGWLSDFLLRRGAGVEVARKHLCVVSMLLSIPFVVAAVSVESASACIVLMMLARLFNDTALAGYMSLPTEMSPRHIGAIWGCMSVFGSLSGVAATMLSGFLVVQTNNWALPFYMGAGTVFVAAIIMALGVSAQPLFGETTGETTEPVAEIEHTSG